MGWFDKLRNRSQISRGRAKQKVGRATGNRRMRAQGLADRVSGSAKQAGQKLKGAGKDARRGRRR